MSSTNKTTNYELSQYIGSDKPTYLGDYNSDMLKIDTQMKTNANNITSVGATATTASETANTAITNASTAQTTAENAQTSATTANNTATTALSKANANETSIVGIQNFLNLNDIEEFSGNQITINNNSFTPTSGADFKITVATNSTGSMAKIYGTLTGTGSLTERIDMTIQTNLRPSSNITINPCGLIRKTDNNQFLGTFVIDIETDGTVRVRKGGIGGSAVQLILLPFVIFVTDFGDVE